MLFRCAGFIRGLFTAFILFAFAGAAAAQDAPKAGQRFGDWVFNCQALSAEETRCALVHELSRKEDGARLLRLTLGRLGAEGEMALVAVVPLGVYLPAGVAVKIDEGEQVAMQMQSCRQSGCQATLQVSDEMLSALRAGKSLFVGFKGGPADKTITVGGSLKGISDGLKALGDGR